MKIIADLHTHTIASGHAYSTIMEHILHAKEIGLEVLAITDHAPILSDAPHRRYFANLKNSLPEYIHGVRVLAGVEANVIDFDGRVDLSEEDLDMLDIVIASCHYEAVKPGTKEDHTKLWMNVAKNPQIHIIGHSGNPEYDFDLEPVIKEFKKYNKIVEINSFSRRARKGSEPNCFEIAKLCKKYEVPVVTNSDAHFVYDVGNVAWSVDLLESIDFPQDLILSTDKRKLFDHLGIKE